MRNKETSLWLGATITCFLLLVQQRVVFAEVALTQLSQTTGVKINEKKIAGYDTTAVPLRGPVRLDLTVNDVDPGADFVPGSGKTSITGGRIAWGITENGTHRFRAQSASFRRFHQKYVVLTNGVWQTKPGGGGTVPIWEVAVAQVELIVNAQDYPLRNKLLATASHKLKAELVYPPGRKPSGTPAWSYSGSGSFAPVDSLDTKFTAGTTLTPAGSKDQQEIRIQYTTSNAVLADSHPLNITAPQKFKASKEGLISDYTTEKTYWSTNASHIAASTGVLMNVNVYYLFKDQFGESIAESDRGDDKVNVRVREDVKFEGDPAIVTWMNKAVKSESGWRNLGSSSILIDTLCVEGLPLSLVYDSKAKRFKTGVLLKMDGDNAHRWHAAVGESNKIDTEFTKNSFKLEAIEVESKGDGNEIKIRTTYSVTVTRR